MPIPRKTKYSQNSSKALNFHSIKRNREIIQRIAILTSFHQSQVLDMRCNWQDERISDKFRDCKERQQNKCQMSAHCSTVSPPAPRVFLRLPSPFHKALLTTAALLQPCAAIVKHTCKIRHQTAFLKLGQNM